MSWKKTVAIIALFAFYLSPLATLSVKVVAGKTFSTQHLIGQIIAIISFLIVAIIWMKDFSASNIVFLKNYSIISKLIVTVILFYVTAIIITFALR